MENPANYKRRLAKSESAKPSMIRSRTPTPRYPLSPYPSPAGSPILPSGAVNADLELPVTAVLQSALVVLAHRMEVQARDFARRDRRAKALPEFHCPVPGCDKKFTRSFNLQGHIRSHWNEVSFKCSWPGCGEVFNREHERKRHERLHSRLLTCDGCGNTFDRHALDLHLSSGSGSPCRDKSLRETSGPSTTTDHDLFPPAGGASTTSNKDAAPLPDVLKAIPLETQCSTSINDLTTQIAGVLLVKARYKRLLASRGDDAQKLLDWLQQLLDIPDLESSLKNNIIVATQRLCKKSGLYPTCYSLTGVEFDGKYPIAAGSFADVYKGKLQGKVVCVKVIRLYQTSQVDYFLKHCSKEAIIWGQLSHPNLLPLYGLYRLREQICLVSPWMERGNITQYLQANQASDRVLLILDVSLGLQYLHESEIVHGDLKGANILVNQCGRAYIADFGLSSVFDANILAWTSHSSAASKGGSLRWQAPELFDLINDENVPNTAASDIYAWSCVSYEIFSGNIPFFHIARDASVMLQVTKGVRPARPSNGAHNRGLTDKIWRLMEDCWVAEPTDRPDIGLVLSCLSSETVVDTRPEEEEDVSPARFRTQIRDGHLAPQALPLDD